MKVTVLGMGNMGASVARRLIAHGHDVTVWNRTPGRTQPLVDLGARAAQDLAAAARAAQAVVLSVRDDEAVSELIDALAAAGVACPIVNCTTSAPAATETFAARCPAFVAAPILGAPQAVADGTATYLVAGPPAHTAHLEALWPALTRTVIMLGPEPARASLVKLMSNNLLLSGLVVLAETVAVGQAAGLPNDLLDELLRASPVVAPALRNRLADLIDGDHRGWFDTPLGVKDLILFADLAESATVVVPMAQLARQRYRAAIDAGYADADVAAVIELGRRP